MTDKLPPNLLALFTPRPPLRFITAHDHAPEKRVTQEISGVAQFLPQLQNYKETDVYHPTESWLQRRDNLLAKTRDDFKHAIETCASHLPRTLFI